MTDNAITNLAMVSNVATRLGDLVENVVFLGGAATALLITDSAANDVRPTMDVDIIALIDGRSELVDEIAQGPENLRIHLAETFRELLRNERFLEALPGHLAGDTASQQRRPILEAHMNRIAEVV